MTNVRNYTDEQLLKKVKGLPSFKYIPKDYWILGVQSNEDKFDHFDDKFYLFQGENFRLVTTGTTNAGKTAMFGYEKYNKLGCAVVKTDEWYYNLWKYGLHRGRMEALRQVRAIKHYRDNNKNTKIEETGELYNKIIGCNFHINSYNRFAKTIKWIVGGWSACCQVVNNYDKYYKILDLVKGQESVSYCLIKEFDV